MIFLKQLLEKQEKYKKGSITIFSTLTMILVASMLVVLLEGCRFQEIKRLSQLQTDLAAEAVFTNYNTALWEEYHLLGTELGQVEEILIQSGNGRSAGEKRGANLLEVSVDNVNIKAYTLLTDGEGSTYVKTVSSYMEKYLLYDTAKEIFNQYEVIKDIVDTSQWDISKIDEAVESVKEPYSEGTRYKMGKRLSQQEEESQSVQNSLEGIQQIKNKGILELVIEDTESLSNASISASEVVSGRELKQGKNLQKQPIEWMDILYLQQYLLNNMSNYYEKKENRALVYELEYIIGGKDKDVENLREVVTQLLAIREMANFLYLTTDIKKMEAAGAMAVTFAGLSANPLLVEVVKIGILTAWAFAESVLDVRALLQGKKIPMLKSEESWTLEWEEVGSITDGYAMAKESQWGLSYVDYLGILLLFHPESQLAYRGMDMQELTIQRQKTNANFKMDEHIAWMQIEMQYEYSPIFFSFYFLENKIPMNYQIYTSAAYGYY